jgi:hypothetical protein
MTREIWLDELENWLDDEPMERLTERYNSLKHFGLYEKALLLTWVHHHDYDDNPLQFVSFFERANRKRLRAEGDEFSYKGEVTLYRGLSGTGERRQAKGLSWTDDIAIATLFAYRWHGRKYSVQPHLAHRAADPTVYTVTVLAKSVLTFINELGGQGKNEREYIVHPDSLPEPTVVEMNFRTIDFNRCKYDWDNHYRLYKCPTVEDSLKGVTV